MRAHLRAQPERWPLEVATGASAGNINAFLAAITWCEALESEDALAPTRNVRGEGHVHARHHPRPGPPGGRRGPLCALGGYGQWCCVFPGNDLVIVKFSTHKTFDPKLGKIEFAAMQSIAKQVAG